MSHLLSIRIDREECIACQVCWSVCPDVFEEDAADGLSRIVETWRIDGRPDEGEAPDDLEECLNEAAEGCPVEIIHIEALPD